MKSFAGIYAQLRRRNFKNYFLLVICNFISVLLISSFSIMMQSNTVQTMLPEGGDSRKQMVMVFVLAIAGCAVFTTYASSLFFRAKSREVGIFMALGASKKQLTGLLFSDLALISLVSSAAGILLGVPLAAGIWQIFKLLVVSSADMAFSLNASGFIYPIAFAIFSMLVLFVMGARFIRRSNIIDVVNEQRKSEPIRDVKRWYGFVGIALMVGGLLGAIFIPQIFVAMDRTPPFWSSFFYLFVAAGLYMVLVYVVVRGFGGKKSYYRNIISRSMMKFQGRQTVLNMCVIAVLIMAAYFAMFYSPMLGAGMLMDFGTRPTDYAFHHRIDEAGIPAQADIEQMAAEEGVNMYDYIEIPLMNLATDGIDRNWTDDGYFGNEYHEFYQEETFISESSFNRISGMDVNVEPGQYIYITTPEYSHSPYDYIEQMVKFTNPVTMQSLPIAFQAEFEYIMMHGYIMLNDADYAALGAGLTDDWKETWVQFNVEDVNSSYAFGKRLKNAIIDGSTEKSSIYSNYDKVELMLAHKAGEEYFGDTVPEMQLDYSMRESSQFMDWRYAPMFRILDRNDFILNLSVYLMLFIFIAIICFAAVIVIAYTRCITIAINNRQVYDDLRHLGAKRGYLFRSVKGQVSKVFFIPALIGTVGIAAFYGLMMFVNTGGFETGELLAFAIDGALIVLMSLILWVVYRITLGKVTKMLDVKKKSNA